MLLQEIILQTRQALQAAVGSRWGLVEEFPPVTQFQLIQDVEIVVLDRDLAEQVMDCCDAQPSGMPKPVRQSPQLYSFVRSTTDYNYLWDWAPDQYLETCIALSRLVHPTSFRLEYHVKISLDGEGKLNELIPLVGSYRGAWIAERDRDWLTRDDCVELQKLVARLPLALPERLNRAFWYNEYAARTYFADVRWTMVATALEALIHTDRQTRIYVAVRYPYIEVSARGGSGQIHARRGLSILRSTFLSRSWAGTGKVKTRGSGSLRSGGRLATDGPEEGDC